MLIPGGPIFYAFIFLKLPMRTKTFYKERVVPGIFYTNQERSLEILKERGR